MGRIKERQIRPVIAPSLPDKGAMPNQATEAFPIKGGKTTANMIIKLIFVLNLIKPAPLPDNNLKITNYINYTTFIAVFLFLSKTPSIDSGLASKIKEHKFRILAKNQKHMVFSNKYNY